MIPRRIIVLCIMAALPGCGDFPEVDAATNPAALKAPYPALVPTESLRAGVPEKVIEDDTTDTLEARADRLRARADRLKRGAIVDSETKARLDREITIDEG